MLATDPDSVYKAVGGMAFVVRRWLAAHRMLADGLPLGAVAPKVMMWNRAPELQALLDRCPPQRLKAILAGIADLDSQAKVGARSIETGIEMLLMEVAGSAA